MSINKCKWFEVCPIKRFYESGKIEEFWIKRYCFGDYLKCERYKLEEKGIYHPDNMLCDGRLDKTLK